MAMLKGMGQRIAEREEEAICVIYGMSKKSIKKCRSCAENCYAEAGDGLSPKKA
jgi:hypothetical protein